MNVHNNEQIYLTLKFLNLHLDSPLIGMSLRQRANGLDFRVHRKGLPLIAVDNADELLALYARLENLNDKNLDEYLKTLTLQKKTEEEYQQLEQELNNILTQIGVPEL